MTEKTEATHGKILSAIAKAMGQVQKVGKEGRNKHDGYDFASIDDFLALVNPICAENGLIVHMNEGAREDFDRQGRNGTSSWMRQSFDITLMHISGETLPPVQRTVEVLRNGAQAYGSAQSYALKQFWRCTLLIPTGDKDDADHAPTDAGQVMRQNDAPPFNSAAARDRIKAQIERAGSHDDLAAISASDKDTLSLLDEAHFLELKNAFADRKSALDADLGDDDLRDEIPY